MVGALLILALLSSPLHAQVVINEIMANPEGSDTNTEYVELYNAGLLSVNLLNWKIANDEGSDTLQPALPLTSANLPAGGYAIILERDYWESGNQLYAGRIPESTLLLVVEDAAIGSGGLTNSIPQTVKLFDLSGDLVSARKYRPNPLAGVSEEQIDPTGGSGDDNWVFSSPGGTPGYINSVTPLPHDLTLDTAMVAIESGGDSLMTFSVQVHNIGTGVSSLSRKLYVHLADTLGVVSESDSVEITALSPSEILITGWELPRYPGGTYSLSLWLTPPDDRAANDSLNMWVELPFPEGALRIVELMANPPASVDVEWVEVVNRSDHPVPLTDWILSDASGTKGRIHENAVFLEPDSVAVFAADSLLLAWPGIPARAIVLVPGSWPSLNNGGDTLRLFDPSETLVDVIAYPSTTEGLALQRAIETDEPDTRVWAASPDPDGGSPGRLNPQTRLFEEGEKPSVRVSPSPFSPDGDGYEDETVFCFTFPSVQVSLTVRLFDRIGRPVGTLLDGRMMPGVSEWVWDGRSGLTRGKLPVGIYVWYTEAVDPATDKRWTLKGTLISAGS